MTFFSVFKNTLFLWFLILAGCGSRAQKDLQSTEIINGQSVSEKQVEIVIAANRTAAYLPLLQNKKVGVVANQTSVIFKNEESGEKSFTHLVDSLLSSEIDVVRVFAPEHGFRGMADAGETIEDGTDQKTGLPIISLYGSQKKPSSSQLEGLDLMLFDIQDVGVRFYTYIATLQLVMEACAAENIPVIILDRPNPNAHYVDGPVMEPGLTGFLGMTPIPLVYGMTIGEYAAMINGEGWLEGGLQADIQVISLAHYTHESPYELPIRPSPNLPNAKAINLYPSLGLFEGTNINAGRGTEYQFQRFGAPFLDAEYFDFSYTPQPNFGSKYPKHQDQLCYGRDLSNSPDLEAVNLGWLIEAYQKSTDPSLVFNTENFAKHAGTYKLQQQIEAGMTADSIAKSWKKDLEDFKRIREKYLIYD